MSCQSDVSIQLPGLHYVWLESVALKPHNKIPRFDRLVDLTDRLAHLCQGKNNPKTMQSRCVCVWGGGCQVVSVCLAALEMLGWAAAPILVCVSVVRTKKKHVLFVYEG